MSPVQASLQKVFLECLQLMLHPLVRFTLHCGLGYSEFVAAVRRVFIEVASCEYGVRGRPANVSRIAAKTGLPRKVVSAHRTRSSERDWTPDDEANPINTIIHYWRFDRQFCTTPGNPRNLRYDGPGGFVELVKTYVGDIPASTIRQELLREEIVEYAADGTLILRREYSFPESLDEDFLRNAAFSIKHHAETLVHNALLVEAGHASERDHMEHGRFERFAWSKRLSPESIKEFQLWTRAEGATLMQKAVEFIARHEDLKGDNPRVGSSISGLGVYFFTDD